MPSRQSRTRLFQALAASLLAVVMLGADSTARFNRVGHKMVCVCSCGQILLECNHVGCPDSDRMIGELRQQMGSGLPDEGIFNWFVNKYGAVVLAAPIRAGFDTVAWITPVAVFLLATLGTALIVRTWTHRTRQRNTPALAGGAPPLSPEMARLRDRIRRETEY